MHGIMYSRIGVVPAKTLGDQSCRTQYQGIRKCQEIVTTSETFLIVSIVESHHPHPLRSLLVRTPRQGSWKLGSIPNQRYIKDHERNL